MRVAWIITGFAKDESDLNGAPSIHNLAKEISLLPGINLDIYSFYYPVNKSHYKYYNANVYGFAEEISISKISKYFLWKKAVKKFTAEYKKEKYDLIHSLWAGESGNIASHLAKKFKIPFIAQVCGGELAQIKDINYGSRLNFRQRLFINRSFKSADKIVIGSEFLRILVQKYYGDLIYKKLVCIPFGVDENKFYNKNTLNVQKNIKLINVANAVPVKNHLMLVKAFKIVKEKYPDAELSVYGKDAEERIDEISHYLNLNGSVHSMGFIDHNSLPDKLNASDVFLLTSLYEAQNVSALEAAFCGVPVVGTNTGILPEITGNIVNSNDPADFADGIIKVLGNLESEKIKSLGKINNLISEYSLKSVTAKFIKLYGELISKE